MCSTDTRYFDARVQLVTGRLELAVLGASEHADPGALLHAAEQLQSAQAAADALAPSVASSALEQRLALSDGEVETLWLLAAVAVSPKARALLVRRSGEVQPDPTRGALVLALYGDRPSAFAEARLAPTDPLRRFVLVERSDGGGAEVHESRRTWAIAPRMLAFLRGDNRVDPILERCAIPDAVLVALPDLAIPGDAIQAATRAVRLGQRIVIATGLRGAGRRTLLASAAAAAGIDVLAVDLGRLSREPVGFRTELRAFARECKLLERVPLLANLDEVPDDQRAAIETDFLALVDGLTLVTSGAPRPELRWNRGVTMIDVPAPSSIQRATLWHRSLAAGTPADAELLATRFPLAPALIVRAARAAKHLADAATPTPDDISRGIRSVLDDRLGQLARRLNVTQTWDDLVLPTEQVQPIYELIARIGERRRVYEDWGFAAKVGKGLGVSALFSGPPGTGKTMLAGLIARDLGLEIYQVDLAKVVSKWIGETERNLAALFDAAEAGHAIVLFDEADALFGKRTEVKSSNDRYANLETNYLLQRLESFTGICVLTTNHETNIDPAFQRRFSLHLRFEVPDVAERERLWSTVLPRAAPVSHVDLPALARRFVMSGGYIRNAALRAAFMAASSNEPISHAHLERAARIEYEAMGKLTS